MFHILSQMEHMVHIELSPTQNNPWITCMYVEYIFQSICFVNTVCVYVCDMYVLLN